MARQTMTLGCTASAMIDTGAPDTNKHGAGSYNVYDYLETKRVLMGFDAFPSALSRKIIYSATFAFSAQSSQVDDFSYSAYSYPAYFDENTVTYNNWTPGGYGDRINIFDVIGTSLNRYSDTKSDSFYAKTLAANRTVSVNGLFLRPHYGSTVNVYTRNAASANRPVITVDYDDTDEATSKVVGSWPKSGYVDPETTQTFSWLLMGDPYYSIDSFVQTSATFSWSSDSGSTWNSVAASGSNLFVTLPANTLPRGTIQWKVTATDDRGATTTSDTYTISTADQKITTTPISPSGTVEDGTEAITFRWNINSPSGTAPLSSILRRKQPPDQSWTDVTISGPATSYTMPANTLTAGSWIWGVNVENQAGIWSSGNPTAQFVCVAVPNAPTVSCDGKPFATIEWQADGQQAWRITVDGKVYGPTFGAAKTFTLPDYLADGPHEASVEIQGSYGLWSQAGTVSFTVQNVPGDAVTLTGVFDRDAALSWETESSTADFLIYRDGVRIGHTTKYAFTDRVVLGHHSWQVVNRLAGGYYTASNALTGTLRSSVTAISALSGGDWTELKLSENSDSIQTFAWSRAQSLRHVAGTVYPVLELSPYEDRSGTYDVSFPDAESAREFEQLKGRAVILKSRGGEVLIGGLTNLTKVMRDFYIAYSFTVQRIHWEDFIDD